MCSLQTGEASEAGRMTIWSLYPFVLGDPSAHFTDEQAEAEGGHWASRRGSKTLGGEVTGSGPQDAAQWYQMDPHPASPDSPPPLPLMNTPTVVRGLASRRPSLRRGAPVPLRSWLLCPLFSRLHGLVLDALCSLCPQEPCSPSSIFPSCSNRFHLVSIPGNQTL